MRMQKSKKLIKKECCLCGEKNYVLLDCHRIIPGSKYTDWGTIIVCSNCHRRIHNQEIVILGQYNSTVGKIVQYLENGEEKFAES